jgi:hypothetical protein
MWFQLPIGLGGSKVQNSFFFSFHFLAVSDTMVHPKFKLYLFIYLFMDGAGSHELACKQVLRKQGGGEEKTMV